MGIVQLPEIRMYWSTDELYGSSIIKKTMTRDRFLLLLKFMHFSNNEDPEASSDRLHKIQHFLDLFNNNCREHIPVGSKMVIDETMVPWRGRLIFRQYNKTKAHKYGIKLYKLCTTTAYCLHIDIYAGKNVSSTRDTNKTIGHTHEVVVKLMKNYLQQGITLYCDNFYNSIGLAEFLLEKQTFLVGTLRKNRKRIPPEVLAKKLKRGEVIGMINSKQVRVLKWKDKRDVLMISTDKNHDKTLKDTGAHNRNGVMIKKPQAVIDYNFAKKGVDVSDQMSSYYTSLRKTLKWYKKVIFEILTGTALVNSWVIYNSINIKQQITMLSFQEKIIKELLNTEEENILRGRRQRHTLKTRSGMISKHRKRCRECYRYYKSLGKTSRQCSKLAKRVATFCCGCEGQPHMCLECFNKSHRQ